MTAYFLCCCSISIHALREEGDFRGIRITWESITISIHALREEGDVTVATVQNSFYTFLSTPSARRATTPKSWTKITA